MNKTQPPTKWTRVDKYINKATVAIFVFQLLLVIIFGLLGNLIRGAIRDKAWYLLDFDIVWWEYFIIPLRFLLLLSLMIPISLKFSMDIVKYVYALLIDWDLDMVDRETNTPAAANSTAISEDLGQVEYIFSDKTGTLTENIMAFKSCSIQLRLFGNSAQYDNALRDPRLIAEVEQGVESTWGFFRALALCNTVVPTMEGGVLVYRSSSPDEEALVKAAQAMRFTFRERRLNDLTMEANDGSLEYYETLATLEFSSDRKRMSIVVRNKATNTIQLIIKGADDKIIPLLVPEDQDPKISEQLEQFACTGLRTLVIAQRPVSEEEFQAWKIEVDQAAVSMQDREGKLAVAYAKLEKDLRLLGVTAIEDKLQEGVPEAISKLREAGIRVWMLTGDKYSTAVQIATSCNLITQEHGTLLTVSGKTGAEVGHSISEHIDAIKRGSVATLDRNNSISNYQSVPLEPRLGSGRAPEISVILEGSTLKIALESCERSFLELSMLAHTVICCRVTPAQKAQVVGLVKDTGKVTLAIGDGGNDVSMIQDACVGVGIRGREGLQAARAADFTIGKFRFLVKLLLVHGRYSLKKTSFVAVYCFHKSLFIAFLQLLYAAFSAFSGTSFFDSFMLASYNVIFTGLPILFYSLDKDVSEENLLSNPHLYHETQKGKCALQCSSICTPFEMFLPFSVDLDMNAKVLAYWFVRTAAQSTIVFALSYLIFGEHYLQPTGQAPDFSTLSAVVYGICITIQTFTILIESNQLTFLNHVVIWGTMVSYFLAMLVLNMISPFLQSVMFRLFMDPNFWAGLALTVFIAFGPFIALKYITFNYNPMQYQVVQFMESLDEDEFARHMNWELNRQNVVYKRGFGSQGRDFSESSSSSLLAEDPETGSLSSSSTSIGSPLLSSVSDFGDGTPPMTRYSADKLQVFPKKEIKKLHKSKAAAYRLAKADKQL
jgi:phospholipid-translocating ATPase